MPCSLPRLPVLAILLLSTARCATAVSDPACPPLVTYSKADQVDAAEQWYSEQIQRHKLYVSENGDDLPEIRDWRWPNH